MAAATQNRIDYFVPEGGLDVVSPPLTLKPGAARAALNFEVDLNLGYRRILGYDRVFGETSVAEMNIQVAVINVTVDGGLTAHREIYGLFSGATMVYRAMYDPSSTSDTIPVYVTDVVGTFIVGEALLYRSVTGLQAGTVAAVPEPISESDPQVYVAEQAVARAAVRASLTAPGINPLASAVTVAGAALGVVRFMGSTWVMRTYNIAGVTDDTVAFCRQNEDVTSSNEPWAVNRPLVIDSVGAKFEFVEHNFYGQATQRALYGVSGTSQAFQFDGTTWQFISTGQAQDKPKHIAVHKNRLFLAVGSSLIVSEPGNPEGFDATLGAAEIACGDEITGLLSVRGGEQSAALLVSTTSKLQILYGDTTLSTLANDNFQLRPFRDDTGASAFSMQMFEQPMFATDYGVTTMAASDTFGGFSSASLTEAVKPIYLARRRQVSASAVVRAKNQYRVFFNDRTGLIITMQGGELKGVMPIQFKHRVTCVHQSTDSKGQELILLGAENGFVYKMESGTSFDGDPIPFHVAMSFNSTKSPRTRKHYMRTAIEIENQGYTAFGVGYDLDYANAVVGTLDDQGVLSPGYFDGPFWDGAELWDSPHRWDGAAQTPIVIDTPGDGENMAIRMSGYSNAVGPFRISGAIVHYRMRRGSR